MGAPDDGKATKQEMVDCYVKILATILGREDVAIKYIYNVSTKWYNGFGCQILEEIYMWFESFETFFLEGSYILPHFFGFLAQSISQFFTLGICKVWDL